MKKFKKKYFFLFCLPLIIGGSILSVVLLNNKVNEGISQEFVIDISDKNYRKVYLLDENKFLIPLSVDVSGKDYIVDEIYTVVSNLRDLEVEGFTSVIAKDVKINRIELENGILNIDFSKEFLTYQNDLEEKIIESLTWSVLDFSEVNGLTISVEGVKLEKMPINGLKLPNVLDKSIGINKYHDMINDYNGSDNVVLLYEKVIGNNSYYVPVTRRVVKENEEVMTIMNNIDNKIGVLSGLKQIEVVKNLSDSIFSYSDSQVSVNLDEDFLIEDSLIDKELYEVIMVTLQYNEIESKVGFVINEESVSVSGYQNIDASEVNNIIFNEVEV